MLLFFILNLQKFLKFTNIWSLFLITLSVHNIWVLYENTRCQTLVKIWTFLLSQNIHMSPESKIIEKKLPIFSFKLPLCGLENILFFYLFPFQQWASYKYYFPLYCTIRKAAYNSFLPKFMKGKFGKLSNGSHIRPALNELIDTFFLCVKS